MAQPVSVSGGEIKTPVGDAPVIPVLLILIGGYLAWFAIHYFGRDVKWPTEPVKDVLTGRGVTPSGPAPETASAVLTSAEMSAAGGGSGAAGGASPSTGSAIADAALKYKGAGYVWGGKADKPGNWDCSSYASYVLGHDLGLSLPGGHYGDPGFPPHAHGPATVQYLFYGQPVTRAQVRAGDLIVWNTHMGIAISNTQMISARDPRQGTNIDKIDGDIPGEIPHFRRVGAAPGTGPSGHTG